MRTTLYDDNNDDKTIHVVICADQSRVLIHVGDRAGGIPFEVGQHIWSYMYTTKEPSTQPNSSNSSTPNDKKSKEENECKSKDKEEKQNGQDKDDDDSLESRSGATELGGFGVGLPLSRLYASYLGGTINLVSLPGHGTHAYVSLPRLPEEMVETVPVRATGWEARRAEFVL